MGYKKSKTILGLQNCKVKLHIVSLFVSEPSVSVEVISKQTRRFSVNKVELDEILMTISEQCDI